MASNRKRALAARSQASKRACLEQPRAKFPHTRRLFRIPVVCGEEEAAVSASQRARWRAGGAVRQRNAPLPMVCNCDRSIVANGLYPHTPDHHCAKQSTSARLPCATVRKSLPLRVAYLPTRVARSKGCGRRGKHQLSFFQKASRNILI